MPRLIPALVLSLVPWAALAAQDGRPDPAKVLAPFVDEFTVAVGVVDVQAFRPDAILKRLEPLDVPAKDAAAFARETERVRATLLQAGARHVYFLFGLGSLLNDPVIVIPTEKKTDTVAALFKQAPNYQTRVIGSTLLAGPEAALSRVKQNPSKRAAAFAKALDALAPLPHRFVAILPETFKRAQAELNPTLPKELGGGSMATLAEGVQWFGVGADLSGDLQLKAVVQAKDAQAAQALDRVAERLLDALRQKPKLLPIPLDAKALAPLRPQVEGDRLVLRLGEKELQTILLPAVASARERVRAAVTMNNLKQLGLAMHTYYDANRRFPPQYSVDKQKKPLLSWRVLLLPFLEQGELYKQFKLNEPWDSPHNKKLIAKMPDVYRSPRQKKSAEEGKTVYLVPTGKELIFNGPNTKKINQITDGTTNTILAVEADEGRAVFWTRPEDYPVDRKEPKKGLVLKEMNGIIVLFADGSVRVLPANTPDKTMWLYFQPSDGSPIPE